MAGTKSYDSSIADKAAAPLAEYLRDHADSRELADALGCTVQAVNQYKQGTAFPKTENLIKIAQHFNVSLDYLVGLSKEPNTSAESKYLTDKLGLSAEATSVTLSWNPHRLKALSHLITHPSFPDILDGLNYCMHFATHKTDLEILVESLVNKYGFIYDEVGKERVSNDKAFVRQSVLFNIQRIFTNIANDFIKESEEGAKNND